MPFQTTVTRFTAGLLLTATLISPAFAATGTVDTAGSSLRIRSEASTSGAVLKKLSHGTQVEVLEATENGWYQISHQGTTGYVSGDYLIVEEEPAAETVAAVTASSPTAAVQTAAETTAVTEPTYIKVTTSVLNVRSGPATTYEKVGTVRAGRVLEVNGQTDGWYQIESGYVSADYVKAVDAAEAAKADKGQEIADYALSFVGYPYVYGGSSPKGFDCSGFTRYVYGQFGYTLNRTASNQLDNGVAVSMSELEPGDLVMFKKSGTGSKRASHVGIYIGNNQFVHASTSKVGVIVSNMSDAYYTSGFVGGRRIV